MTALLVESQPMAKAGRPKRTDVPVAMTGIKIEREVNELLRKGAAIRGETIVGYANRIMREYAEADILEDAKLSIQKAEEAAKKKGKPLGGEA